MRTKEIPLLKEIEEKTFQEQETLKAFQLHNERDAQIRKILKHWGDYFRRSENRYREEHQNTRDVTSS